MILAPKRRVVCPRCASTSARVSSRRSAAEWLKALVGIRTLRCQRCLGRYAAFAPALREVASAPQPTGGAVLPQPVRTRFVAPARQSSPLADIEAIEREWHSKIQPEGLVEETLCAQLAHATWHLRSVHQAERESIAASVRNGSFDGESALTLMQWRLSVEDKINSALEQLERYRQMAQRELPRASSVGDLLALRQGLSRNAAAGVSSRAMA